MPALIVVGDRTSHGGVVIQGSPMTDTHGKSIARVGDRVTCPQKGHGGTTVIVSGDPTLLIDGSAAARHGDKTACGATLLSSQVVTTDDVGGGGGGSSRPNQQVAAVAAAAAAASYAIAKPSASTALRYDQHFLVKDEKTGKPLPNIPYRLTLETGREIKGTTDQNGCTEKIGADSALTAKLEVPYYGNSTGSAHTNDQHDACGC